MSSDQRSDQDDRVIKEVAPVQPVDVNNLEPVDPVNLVKATLSLSQVIGTANRAILDINSGFISPEQVKSLQDLNQEYVNRANNIDPNLRHVDNFIYSCQIDN